MKLSAIKANCGIEVCLDECLRKLEAEDKAARKAEAERREEAGMKPSRAAEEGAAAVGPEDAEAGDDNAPVTADGDQGRTSMGEYFPYPSWLRNLPLLGHQRHLKTAEEGAANVGPKAAGAGG